MRTLYRFTAALIFGGLLAAQGPVITPVPPGANLGQQGSVEIPPPTKPALDPEDQLQLAKAQRDQQWKYAEYQRKRAEADEAKELAEKSDQVVLTILSQLKQKYGCTSCDLSWSFLWLPPDKTTFAKPKENKQDDAPED